jgi:MscS family membrane protein
MPMRSAPSRRIQALVVGGIGWLLVLTACPARLAAETPQPAGSVAVARNSRDFLTSPREALRTLYYSAVAYDLRPYLMDEAIECLDLDPARKADTAEAARLVLDLEQVLRILCVPINGVPELPERDNVVIADADNFKIALARGTDGLWRFDRTTIDRIPLMSRASVARFRSNQADRGQLVEDFADPSSTMRRFLIDSITRDFYSAARCLDLSTLRNEERAEQGPYLAKKLAFVMQRRGWLFLQEVPNQPDGPPFTWHADKAGRIVLERVRLPEGKDAWLFSKKTVRNLAAMYDQVKDRPADARYVRIGVALAPLTADDDPSRSRLRPANVPAHLGTPRAMLKGFFRVMDVAEHKDARLAEALDYLDLAAIPTADRAVQGARLAIKLEAVLRKVRIELSAVPDDWTAATQLLGGQEGVRIEIVRQRDGCWRFSANTIAQIPALFDKLASKNTADPSARDAMNTFLTAMRRSNYEQAATCLDLSWFRPGTQEEIGNVLAYKLRYVMDRIGRVYLQEVPDTPEGPPYVFYRGDLGRIVIARRAEDPHKGAWLFTRDTVALIEPMFQTLLDHPVDEASRDNPLHPPSFWSTPGIWVRLHVPPRLHHVLGRLELYQWLGLVLALVVSALLAWFSLAPVHQMFALVLHKSGSVLSGHFLAAKLRPLTWVIAWWYFFEILSLLDLPIHLLNTILPIKTFGMAGLIGWFGFQFVDLATAIYVNSELLRPHRSLSDMIVPASMRALKAAIFLVVAVYVIYQVGEGDLLGRFLTALGVAGLAASLAAQDAMKSFFSTLLLIGERSFKIGDRINLGGQEGVVEQVGFRATRLRTADGSLLTIPNSNIASAPIDNLSTKAFSRCKATLLVGYDTAPDHVLALRDRIRAWLLQHPSVRPDRVDVSVNRLTEKGVEVTLDLYLNDVSGEAERSLREEINCEVLRLCEALSAGQDGAAHPLTSERTGLPVHRGAA